MSFSITLEGTPRRASRLLRGMFLDELKAAVNEGLRRSAEIVVKRAQQNLTSGGNVFMGTLRASLGYEANEDRLEDRIGPGLSNKATSRFGDPKNYGYFVEHGRGAGGAPPVNVMRQWVMRKLGITGKEGHRVAYLIGQKIAREGTQPHPFLEPAAAASESRVKQTMEDSLNKTIAKLNERLRR